MRERDVEAYLVKQVKAAGGEVRKLRWIGRRGAPDRLVLLRGAHFVELKRPGEKLEDHQDREHNRMRKNDVFPWVLDTFEAVDAFMRVVDRVSHG